MEQIRTKDRINEDVQTIKLISIRLILLEVHFIVLQDYTTERFTQKLYCSVISNFWQPNNPFTPRILPCSLAEGQTKVAILFCSFQYTGSLKAIAFLFHKTATNKQKRNKALRNRSHLIISLYKFSLSFKPSRSAIARDYRSCQNEKRACTDSLPTTSRPMAINSEDAPNP